MAGGKTLTIGLHFKYMSSSVRPSPSQITVYTTDTDEMDTVGLRSVGHRPEPDAQ